MMVVVGVWIAGAAGAVSRYLISGWVHQFVRVDFPLGTLAVNLAGSLGLGLIAGTDPLESTLVVLAVGFLGGFTTFSTLMIETIRLGLNSPRTFLNLTVSVIGGLALAAVGYTLTS